ncbi:hypothetical protein M2352_002786 [Azospirillum fermentarium]|uniref:hypothetical protein n=1 Tax=Azospirillum fermentarium TaxID=1233114 RepID=UPI002225D302|nr:hypothetical protein [Azospirillum fermentarium]MCW2247195.1 hypothetical protein [Azospirillum fermentarium]
MANVVDTTGTPLRVQNSQTADSRNADPVTVLLDVMERQVAGWKTLSPDDDDLRDRVAALTWDETSALLRRTEPTTLTGVIRALHHVVDRIAHGPGGGPRDHTLPLARNAVAALERMVGA